MDITGYDDIEIDLDMKNKISKYLIPLLALAGLILSVILTVVYYNANFVTGASPSFCSLNETINCDAVARTEYSRFLGVPLSLWGLGFYLLMLFVNFIPFISKIKFFQDFKPLKNPQSYVFTLASISIIVSIALGIVQVVQIHKICILCCATYVVDLAILIISKSGISFKEHYLNTINDTKVFLEEPVCILGSGIIFTILILSLSYFNLSKTFIPNNPNITLPSQLGIPQIQKSGGPIGNVLGSKNPKLVIREYTDFECPVCAIFSAMMQTLVKDVDGVQVIHNDFPLDMECNALLKHPMHKNSCLAALYARAAKEQGKFWDYDNLLFDNQKDFNEDKFISLAKSLNLNTNEMENSAHNLQSMSELKSDVNKAYSLGVHATPTYFIGIRKYEGLMPYPKLKEIVLQNMK